MFNANYNGCICLSLLKAQTSSLIEEICSRGTEIDNLWASITVLFQSCALCAVVCIGNTWCATNDTSPTIISKVAFVTDADEGLWADV